MISLFFSLVFVGLIEARVLLYPESVWPLALLPVWAALSCWWTGRALGAATIGFFLGALSLAFSLWAASADAAHAGAVAGWALFFALLYALRTQRAGLVVLLSFIEVVLFFWLVLSLHLALHLPLWALAPAVGAGAAALFFASQTLMLELGFWLKLRLALLSFVAGLVMAESFWMFSQLPFHVVNIDFLLGIVYYTLWNVTHRYFSLEFTKRSLWASAAMLFLGFLAVLVSARWFPN
mgnify:CR=1 FL=1